MVCNATNVASLHTTSSDGECGFSNKPTLLFVLIGTRDCSKLLTDSLCVPYALRYVIWLHLSTDRTHIIYTHTARSVGCMSRCSE